MGTKAYSSQAQAQTAFNNKFTSEPATRPVYIPNDVVRGTVHYHVVYHSGCYGYYDPTGLWIALAATDAIMNANQMASNQVAANQATQQATQPIQTPPVHHGAGFYFTVILSSCVLIAVVFIIVKAFL